MKTLLGIRTVYDIDMTKTFRIADILEAGAILPHSVPLSEVMVEDLEEKKQPVKTKWSARCNCYKNHNSSSGRCNTRDVDGDYCESCVEHCGCVNDEPEQCRCIEYAGDDPECPVHGWAKQREGSDTSTMTQLQDAGYGCGGLF